MEPWAQGVVNPEHAGFTQQDEKGRLKGILGVVRIAQQCHADALDHGPVPLDQGLKGELGGPGFADQELFEQLPV